MFRILFISTKTTTATQFIGVHMNKEKEKIEIYSLQKDTIRLQFIQFVVGVVFRDIATQRADRMSE